MEFVSICRAIDASSRGITPFLNSFVQQIDVMKINQNKQLWAGEDSYSFYKLSLLLLAVEDE